MEKYTHLNQEERLRIYEFLQEGKTKVAIAEEMGRNKSTIGRELKRNKVGKNYLPDTAEELYKRRRVCRKKKIESNPELKAYVTEKLTYGWSPEQIAGRIKKDTMPFSVCAETIYQFVYALTSAPLMLYQYLRYNRQSRGIRHGRCHRSRVIKNRVPIEARPKALEERSCFGDLEGDLTFFHGNQSANLTVMADRSSRYIMLIKNMSKQTAVVIDGIKNRIKDLPIRSITFDNGSEFAHHTELNDELKIDTYFCNPGSPWQKGTVENSINRLHRFIPKNADLKYCSDRDIEEIEKKLNSIPRKVLGYATPKEVFDSHKQKCCTSN